MKKYLAGLVLMLVTVMAFALPSPRMIEDALVQQNYSDANSMTQEVLREKPDSAKAHLFNAYLLIHVQHDKAGANAELSTAANLDRKGDVKNSSLFGRTVAEIDLQKSAAPRQQVQPQYQAPRQIVESPVTYQEPKKSGHGLLIFFIVFLVVGGGLVWLFVHNTTDRTPQPAMSPRRPSSESRGYLARSAPLEPVNQLFVTPPVVPQNLYQREAAPTIIQQGNQGLGFGGTMAATAGGVVAGELIHDALRPKRSSFTDDDYEENRRRREREDRSTTYTPDPYVPAVDSTPVSSSNERASYSSGSDDSSWSSGSGSYDSGSSSSWDSGSSSSYDSGSSSSGSDW